MKFSPANKVYRLVLKPVGLFTTFLASLTDFHISRLIILSITIQPTFSISFLVVNWGFSLSYVPPYIFYDFLTYGKQTNGYRYRFGSSWFAWDIVDIKEAQPVFKDAGHVGARSAQPLLFRTHFIHYGVALRFNFGLNRTHGTFQLLRLTPFLIRLKGTGWRLYAS